MTPEQQTPASVVETELSNNPCQFDRDQPVSNHYKLAEASKAFLTEAARYFEARPTGGEDAAHWSNVFNAKNCREAAALIERLSAEREGLEAELVEARTFDKGFYEWMIERDLLTRGEEVEWGDIVVALTEHEVECSALTQGESRQTGWQPIETIPDADVLVLAWTTDSGGCAEVWSAEQYRLSMQEGASPALPRQEAALVTHWMPLPAAPTPADGGGE
jgi:hypothetical protein